MFNEYENHRNDLKVRLKEAREAAGLTQKELAEAVGIAQSSIHAYEKSNKTFPPLDVLVKIIQATNCNPLFILGFSNDIEKGGMILEQVTFRYGKKHANYDWLVNQILGLNSFRSLIAYIYMAVEQESPILDYSVLIHGLPLPVIAGAAGVDEAVFNSDLGDEHNTLLFRKDACLYNCHRMLDAIIEQVTEIAKGDGFINFDSTATVSQYIQKMEEEEANGKESNDQGR